MAVGLTANSTRPAKVRDHGAMTAEHSRVAIVDDDASVRKALSRLLNACALDSETFGSGREFLDSLSDRRPQCVVVDQPMPEMTGLDLQRHLRRHGIKIPAIIITAHDQPGLREQCRTAGAIAYLLKPLKEDELIAAVSRAVNLL
jgi:FixJ family two-component response regulator